MTHDDDELARILAEIREREGPPVEYDPRALRAVLCGVAVFWIAVAGGVWHLAFEWRIF